MCYIKGLSITDVATAERSDGVVRAFKSVACAPNEASSGLGSIRTLTRMDRRGRQRSGSYLIGVWRMVMLVTLRMTTAGISEGCDLSAYIVSAC